MPDFNKYAANVPYVRPELPKTGLALIVKPVYDYVNTFPDSVNFGDAGQVSPFDLLNKGEKNPFAHLGVVPIAPAAATPYNISRRYNDPELMFMPNRDNEDLYAKNQGFFDSIGKGLGRLVLTTGTKLGTGIGYLGGLMGLGNHYENYAPGFAGWLSGAADNALVKWFENAEDETIKQDWLPLYQEAADVDKGFFRRAATDLNFWTEDFSDGAAFMASAFVPGMAISKLGLGTTFLRNAAYLRGLTYGTEEAALAAEGLSGAVESTAALAEGATVRAAAAKPGLTMFTTPGTPLSPGTMALAPEAGVAATTRVAQEGLQELPRVFSWIDNARLARNIDVGATTILNTASESMFEANAVKKDLIDRLSQERNPDGTYKYTTEQVRLMAAQGARDTYLMNMGALALSNLWEANLMFKKLPSRGTSVDGRFETQGLWNDVKLQKKTFGQRISPTFKDVAKGVGAEGFWEENIQLAIERLNSSNENFDLDFGGKLAAVANQYVNQTFGALSGSDREAAQSIGLGGLIGGIAGRVFGDRGVKPETAVSNLNSQVSVFKTLGNIYETDDSGKIKMVNGGPVVDVNKLKSYVASLNKVVNMDEISRNLEARGVNELAQVYKDEVFARYAKAHFDNGLGELLHKKLDDVKNITPEDMALLGFDPSSKDGNLEAKIEAYKNRAVQLENLYDNVQRNYLPFRKDKKGQKFYNITDKIFYMSARMQSLGNQIAAARQRGQNLAIDSLLGDNTFNAQFNAETDAVVDKYNQLFENLQAAKRQTQIAYEQDAYLRNLEQPVSETRRGVTVSTPSRMERVRRENPSVAVSLPASAVEASEAELAKRQKELDDYVAANKEVLERLKKDSRGRYLYEIANKNILPSAKELERLQILEAEFGLAQDSTMKALTRLSDLVFGERYYDQVYAPALARQASRLATETTEEDIDSVPTEQENIIIPQSQKETVLNEDEIDKAYDEAVEQGSVKGNTDQVVEHIANKISKGSSLTEKEQVIRETMSEHVEDALRTKKEKTTLGDVYERQGELEREKDVLENVENRTDEQNQRLDEIYNELDSLEQTRIEKFDQIDNDLTVEASQNIKPEDKEEYKNVLNNISKNKRRVVKYDDYYEVDGQRYNKVTDIIGDVIPDDVRAKVQNAVNAGYTVDAIVKALLDNTADEAFKNSVADKISEEAYNDIVAQVQKIQNDLRNKGIEIAATNVIIFDESRKVAGEIDVLGIDQHGNFKIYEIQARRPEVYKMYGLRGRGIKIRELDQQRLSAYRNMFANQYGVVPDEISIMFPFQVKYDKESPKGYIEDINARKQIRFTPSRSVQIKRKIFEPIRTGSKFDNIDLLRIFANTFLTNEDAKGKVRFLMRNVPLDEIKKKITMTVRNAEEQFQERFEKQQGLLNGQKTDYKLTKYPGFDNLYALAGNKEIAIKYEDTLLGYMAPAKALAYKDESGNYQVLDENTDVTTYTQVTGNSEQTYPEFKRIAQAYTYAHGKLVDMLETSGQEQVVLNNDQVQEMFEPSLSYGEFDKVPTGQERPNLAELQFSGVMVGKKQVPTVIHIDANDSIMVMMEKTKRTKNTNTKYYDVDRWANNNLDTIVSAITNSDGRRVTEYVGVIELPNGEYRIIPLRKKKESKIDNTDDFVTNLGNDFTAATSKNVFKNESIMMVPKYKEDIVSFDLLDATIAKKVYPAEDIDSLEKFGLSPADAQQETHEDRITSFTATLSQEQLTKFNKLYPSGINLIDEYNNSIGFSNLQDYLEYIKECKL